VKITAFREAPQATARLGSELSGGQKLIIFRYPVPFYISNKNILAQLPVHAV
jgi:hypothetical protein